jgi:hypothetical protein
LPQHVPFLVRRHHGASAIRPIPRSNAEIAHDIKAKGGTLDSEPVDAPWGARYFRMTDPDGFKLAILKRLA